MTKINKFFMILILVSFCTFYMGQMISKLILAHKLGELEKAIENLVIMRDDGVVLLLSSDDNLQSIQKKKECLENIDELLDKGILMYINIRDKNPQISKFKPIKSDAVFVEVLRYKMEKVLMEN